MDIPPSAMTVLFPPPPPPTPPSSPSSRHSLIPKAHLPSHLPKWGRMGIPSEVRRALPHVRSKQPHARGPKRQPPNLTTHRGPALSLRNVPQPETPTHSISTTAAASS